MKEKENKSDSNQYMTVKTVYARVAVLLLAANFGLTGYCLLSLSSSQQEQIDGLQGVTAPVTLSTSPQTSGGGVNPTATRDN